MMAGVLSFINKSKFDRLKISYDVKKSFKNLFFKFKSTYVHNFTLFSVPCNWLEVANQIAIHLEFNHKVEEFRTTVNFIDTNLSFRTLMAPKMNDVFVHYFLSSLFREKTMK